MVLYCPIQVIIIQCCKPCHLMSQVIMEKILALIRKNDPLISDVMWPCHLLPVLPTLYPDYPGHGNCFCCIIVIPTLHHIWPHTVCGMQWSQLQLSIVIIYYREQSGSVSPTHHQMAGQLHHHCHLRAAADVISSEKQMILMVLSPLSGDCVT